MKTYLPLIVPICFYTLVGWTVFHFEQPAWLFTLLISPRIELRYIGIQKSKENEIVAFMQSSQSGKDEMIS